MRSLIILLVVVTVMTCKAFGYGPIENTRPNEQDLQFPRTVPVLLVSCPDFESIQSLYRSSFASNDAFKITLRIRFECQTAIFDLDEDKVCWRGKRGDCPPVARWNIFLFHIDNRWNPDNRAHQ